METEIPKVYSPENIEPRWAHSWVAQKLYRPADESTRPNFCLVIPPPNITGSLHMGHMLEHTEIDILIRWHRMRGENVLWLPGTDHAAIATQMIVERELGRAALPNLEGPQAKSAWQREGQRLRIEMGRDKFIERCWKWKEENGGTIRRQMERLGASVDWTRDRFTMDAAYTRSVQEVFIRLYEEGLIYRGQYIVNWCPRCCTAVSDLEVVHEDRPGHLWYIRYPFEDGPGHLTVATTRPETMLGDTAVAVNPADQRYQAAVGRKVVLPLLGRIIPLVADDFVDPKFGTGAVKVTPAHDSNDYAISQRHDLPRVVVIDEDARMTADAGPAYQGLDRYAARAAVVQDLREQGYLDKIEDYPLSVGTCQRCKTVIEPLLSTQWFLKTQPLAEPAIRVVEDGRIRITPENYKKIYLDWMNKIYDWCISRQLWWGHRIPAWYCHACGEVIVAHQTPAQCPKCASAALRADADTLDTWFSSGLWPFATLGWPEETTDLFRFYPNNLMIMGFDILFFWGARMIMLGLKFMKDVPFRELYIHALVRDAERQKMSKTKGNVIDPLEIIERFGTDATRFTLAAMAAPGTDIAFSESRTDGYRAFANKIWNAARFMFMNVERVGTGCVEAGLRPALAGSEIRPHMGIAGFKAVTLEDRWILSRFNRVAAEVNGALETYRFHEAANCIYDFFWGEFCDWYLELIKPRLNFEEGADKSAARAACANLVNLFDASLRLLHPVMPFITEEIWQAIYEGKPPVKSIALTAYPQADEKQFDLAAETEMAILQDLIVSVRNLRAELKIEPKVKAPIEVFAHEPEIRKLIEENRGAIERLANVDKIRFVDGSLSKLAGARHTARFDVHLVYERKIDVAAECERLKKEMEKIEKGIASGQKQLGNEQFLAKAPASVVENLRKQQQELAVLREKTQTKRKELGCP